jgi:hypothetical protein
MSAIQVDTTRLPLLLHDLRLPAIARLWPEFSERADKEGWPAARFLSALAELEIALFELIGAYERHSMLITANQPFADWNKVFPDSTLSWCLSL